jgi:hypothetical protein
MGRRLAALIVAVSVLAVGVCDSAGAATGTDLGLAGCVKRWNSARLGDGRAQAGAVSAYSRAALLTYSRDGICILAFPGRSATASGGYGVFVSAAGGDYWVGWNPFEAFYGRPHAVPALELAAGHERNVELAPHGGGIARITDPAVRAKPYPAIATRARESCRTVETMSARYRVRHRAAGCMLTRVVTWAWAEGEGRLLSRPGAEPRVREILGWRCEGDFKLPPEGKPVRATCANGSHHFELLFGIPHAMTRPQP